MEPSQCNGRKDINSIRPEYATVFTDKPCGEFHDGEKSVSNAGKPTKCLYRCQTEN